MSTSNHAKALFTLAKDQDVVDLIHYQFEEFRDEMDIRPEWVDMMDSPMIHFTDKCAFIDQLKYHVLFRSFLKMLAEKNHMYAYKEIYSVWTKHVRQHLKIAHLNIITAKPLTEETEHRILKVLKPTFPNHTISLHKHVDPNLIGGIQIIYQGQSLDRSVARELEELYTMI